VAEDFSIWNTKKNDIEFYDKVMDLYPDYPKIWRYNLVARYKAKVKGYFSNFSKIRLSIKYFGLNFIMKKWN
jgi:hypothetical protein